MIEVAKDAEIEKLVSALTKSAFGWGEACGAEGYSAQEGDSYIDGLRYNVTRCQDALYQYFLDLQK